VAAAHAAGAAVALVARIPDGVVGPCVVVEDPLAALAALAHAARTDLTGTRVVAVTGSAGKTSTKELLAAALAPARRVHANAASHNNEFGLPVTILGADPDTEVLVLEMGERFPGDLAHLCGIARPEIGIVTHVGLAHAEHLGDRDGVVAVLAEMVRSLPADGLTVLNADCDATPTLRTHAVAPVLTAGLDAGADVHVTALAVDDELRACFDLLTPWGRLDGVRLEVRGAHQAVNAAQAAAVALHLGVGPDVVAAGLGRATGAHWRMELARSAGGVTVLNDAYNASPGAMESALHSLDRLPARRRFAVLGAMLELGPHGAAEHARMGRLAASLAIDTIVVVPEFGADALADAAEAAGGKVVRVADAPAAAAWVAEHAASGDAVLVKASRRVGLEAVAAALLGAAA
jgi:UDP-N-acetylmuramoyl-tripeptide--D-alanyl-D-alanine ligase